MSTAQVQDAYVTPPVASATPGVGVTCLATDTTSRTYDLDAFAGFYGPYVDFVADGGKIYFVLDEDATGAINESVAGAAGAATAIADGTTEAVPWPLNDGQVLPCILVKGKHRYLHVKAASGTPKLRIRASSPPSALAPRESA